MGATSRAVLVRRVMKQWSKLRLTFAETTLPYSWPASRVKALSNITLRSLITEGHPPYQGGKP